LSTCEATSTVTLGRALEHRADDADRHAPLEHPLAGGEGADEPLDLQLGGGREDVELVGHVGEALGGEAEPVEQPAAIPPASAELTSAAFAASRSSARSRSSPAAARRAASTAAPPAARTPGAAAAARCAASRTATDSTDSEGAPMRESLPRPSARASGKPRRRRDTT
jgi:hypothetical protein